MNWRWDTKTFSGSISIWRLLKILLFNTTTTMPNWCSNQIEITTNVEPSEFLSKQDGEYYLHFNKVANIGEWDYNKALEAWWVKWDVWEFEDWKFITNQEPMNIIEDINWYKTYSLFYETPRAPPTEFLQTLFKFIREKDWDALISNEHCESWMGFIGYFYNWDRWDRDWDYLYIEELESYVTWTKESLEHMKQFEDCILVDEALIELKKLFKDGSLSRTSYYEYKEELQHFL